MDTKDVIFSLRTKNGFTREELAHKVFADPDSVSRWESGALAPDEQALRRLSLLFHVSVNTLLGSPKQLICQCCGMPLDDPAISHEPDGSFNEDYCRWCYQNGAFQYTSQEALMDYLVNYMSTDQWSPRQARAYFTKLLPTLKYWKEREK